MTASYHELMNEVRNAGLLGRTIPFYIVTASVLTLCLGGAITGFVLLGDSWFQLLIAAALGIILTQFAFITHEASHRQVFQSGPANDRIGRVLAAAVVGISYTWWMTKHTRHHANPNTIGKDPDIEVDTLSFVEEDAAKRTGFLAALTRKQGYLFFPLLLLEGLNLHARSLTTLVQNKQAKGRRGELTMIIARLTAYLAIVFIVLPPGLGAAFVGVQLAVFGLYMGASFAPNHKGMPLIEPGARLDFLSKQVLTSRNISGGTPMSMFMGGLNYQVEHHLFPSMARPHLAKARLLVKEHCNRLGMPYTETTLVRSYAIVVDYLNTVGLQARDPFDCPLMNQYRRP